ncbi:uncharacterized protein BJ171DRAFT_581968 [Polychytrium aggregatum]|uniref:uncharacterized protein n=1 Tax=Polychytrium aggregatum TaxID=110093 RepID=UPI0022FEA152|nr:uncharacterized protein BJ171DRAFT_581968 [Polychytrium aggregatum]KAI9204390.1 hypothetical protein BJ171DRAFT_581968 [Polychytrium aggregatum]
MITLNQPRRIVLAMLVHLVQFLCAAIFLGGIADQAQFGPNNQCLLFISNFNRTINSHFTFSATSLSCSYIILVGSVGVVLSLIFGVGTLYFLSREASRAARVILAYAATSTIFSLLLLVAASLGSIGIRWTCGYLEQSGVQCASVFASGFTENNGSAIPKNLGTINAAIGAGWFGLLVWVLFALLELRNWKNTRNHFKNSTEAS